MNNFYRYVIMDRPCLVLVSVRDYREIKNFFFLWCRCPKTLGLTLVYNTEFRFGGEWERINWKKKNYIPFNEANDEASIAVRFFLLVIFLLLTISAQPTTLLLLLSQPKSIKLNRESASVFESRSKAKIFWSTHTPFSTISDNDAGNLKILI